MLVHNGLLFWVMHPVQCARNEGK